MEQADLLTSRSAKHLRDINGILKIRKESMDLAYILTRAKANGVDEIWQRLITERGQI